MSHRYAPVLNPSSATLRSQNDREAEMQAAFDNSDDEDDFHNTSETQPLNPVVHSPSPSSHNNPGTYNFESADYDYPPPGSPPPPSALALPNSIGNSNGVLPTLDPASRPPSHVKWYQRAATTVLPSSALRSLGFTSQPLSGPVGGGTLNDGVFANVTAKPSAPVTIQDGDDIYVVPEDARTEAPPSYASAQADAVPPYWETTVHAPFAPDTIGEMVIDSLPTGSLFSFCWNLLVSVSFQFVGFLLTYLLHTSHAARLGSRAGLGITLIQYGFALRSQRESGIEGDDWSGWGGNSDVPADDPPPHHHHPQMQNVSWSTPVANMTEEQANQLVASATTEWLSFFLMTIGWFVLLTSLLGFWRVKRWERGVLASRRDENAAPPTSRSSVVSGLESSFGLRGMSRIELLRQGFGFGNRHQADEETTRMAARTEEGQAHSARETDVMIPPESAGPNRSAAIARALAQERRLQQALRDAGF